VNIRTRLYRVVATWRWCSRINLQRLRLNDCSPITRLFRRSRQNSYLSRAFEFGYIVTSPITTLFVGPRTIFCVYNDSCKLFYSLKCKLGYVEPQHKYLMTE